jgi:hypothetical protein
MADYKSTAFIASAVKTYLHGWKHDADRMLSKTHFQADEKIIYDQGIDYLKHREIDFDEWTLTKGEGYALRLVDGVRQIQIDIYHHKYSPEKFIYKDRRGKKFMVIITRIHDYVDTEDEAEDEDDCIEEDEDEDEEKFEDCMHEFSFDIASAIGQHLVVC